MAGVITATSISGSLDAKNIVMGVLKEAIELSNLAPLGTQVSVPELTGTIPLMNIPEGLEDLKEGETGEVNTGSFSYVSFDLKKDRVVLGVTDEARFKSKAGDPLALQKTAAADRLAYLLDKKIVAAMETSPQTGATAGAWSTVSNNPMVDLATAAAALRPYTADFVVMPSAVWAKFCGNNYTAQFVQGNAARDMKGVMTVIPGLELKVYINDLVTAKSILVGASKAPPFVFGQGPVKVRQYENEEAGMEMYQMDVWRQVKAPILKNGSNLNKAIRQVTAVIA